MAFSKRFPVMVMTASAGSSSSFSVQRLSGFTVSKISNSAACIIFPITKAQMGEQRMQSAVWRMAWLDTRLLLIIKVMAAWVWPVWR